ncbi:MAG: hypothetical protein NXI04_11145 [Planctomycetaceae bacterium]|nr:hypothetical protein [Planctomycetaceae bacterium]
MTSRPQWIALTSVLFLCGCQAFDSLTPWRKSADARFTAEELAALDAQPIEPLATNGGSTTTSDLMTGGPAPIRPGGEIVQASYGTTQPPAAAGRIDQLVQSGQSVVAQSQSDPVALQTARSYFEQALALDQNHSAAHHGMAIVADLTHDYPTAEMHYKQALVGNPNDANLLNDLGYSYILQHRFADAASFLNRAAQIAPENRQPKVNLALLALKKGDRAEAQRVLSQIYPADAIAATMSELEARIQPVAQPTGVPSATFVAENSVPAQSDPGLAAADVLQRVQQERERAQVQPQMAASDQPIHVFPPGVNASAVTPADLISVPGGQQFQIETPPFGAAPAGMMSPPMTAQAMPGMAGSSPDTGYPAAAQPLIQSVQDVHGQAMANLPVAQPYPSAHNYQQPLPASSVSLRSAPVAGLNAGPGALFPVASMQRSPQPATQMYPAAGTTNPTTMPAAQANYGQPITGQPNVALPGTMPPGNAPAFGSPAIGTYPQQRLPNGGPATGTPPSAPYGAPQPGGQTVDPLEAYERQLQSLDSQYNQAVRQLGGQHGVQPVPAQY